MRDYTKGKIYKIVNDIDDYVYVGSTTDTLCRRLTRHRTDMKRNLTFNIYEHMKKHGIEHFKIILIRNACCSSREELLREERIEYDKIDKEKHLNKIRPLLTVEEKNNVKKDYYNNNKDKMKTWNKNWIEANKEKNKIQQKIYHKNNKEKISENKKIYYKNNKEYLQLYKQKYHQHNKLMQELPFYRVPLTISF